MSSPPEKRPKTGEAMSVPPPPTGGYHQPPPYSSQGHYQQPPYGGGPPPPPPPQQYANGYMWQQQQPPPPYGGSSGWSGGQGPGGPPMGMYRQGGPPPPPPPPGMDRGYGYRGGPPAPPRHNEDNSPPRPKGGKGDGPGYWGQQQWQQPSYGGGPPPPPSWQGGPPHMQQQPPGPSPPPPPIPPKMWNRSGIASPPRGPRRSPDSMMGPGYRMGGMDMMCKPLDDDLYHDMDSKSKNSDKDKGRGSYRCGRCGAPKKGHVCPYQPKLKRRPDEPPPDTRNAAIQVEMDEFMTLRRLNIEIQGFPESYASAPLIADNMVVGEPHPLASVNIMDGPQDTPADVLQSSVLVASNMVESA